MDSNAELSAMVQAFFKSCGLLPGTTSVVAGVSGGVDSMVMLHLLAVTLKFEVTAAHVNYGKRGTDSEADEQLVRSYCSRHGIPLEVKDARCDRIDATSSGNFQDHARVIRRRFFRSVMKKKNATAIVLAHHRDDQIETIVQKVWRGSAIENWEGMQTIALPWVRPLLEVPKKDLISFAEENRIPYRIDTSNLESGYARNMLRNEIFPRMEDHFPGWKQNMIRLSEMGSVHLALLDHVTDEVTAADKAKKSDFSEVTLNRSRWLNLSEILRIPVARHWIRKTAGHVEWSRGIVSRLSDLEHLKTGGMIPVSDRVAVMRDRSRFVIIKGSDPEVQCPIRFRVKDLPDKSEDSIEYAGFLFSRSVYRPDTTAGSLQLRWESLESEGKTEIESVSSEELILRLWEKGDRFRPFGMNGYQSVADHLTNRKISAAQKSHTLVLVSFDGSIHAVIFPHYLKSGEIGTIAEHTRCHTAGQEVLLISKNE